MKSRSRLFAISVAVACLVACLIAATAQAALPAWVPIAASGPTNLPPVQSEAQRVAVDAEGGTFRLTFSGQQTAPIAFDAPAATVKTELDALSTIGGLPTPGSVTVEGGPGSAGADSPYFITFGDSLADVDVTEMSANGTALTGGDNHVVSVTTALNGGPGSSTIAVYVQNVGGLESSGKITLGVTLPTGVKTTGPPVTGGISASAPDQVEWSCLPPTSPGQGGVTCENEGPAQPGFTLSSLKIPVTAEAGASSGLVQVEVSGGGTVGTATYDMPLVVSALDAPPGLQSFTAAAYDENGLIDKRAGAHPYSASAGILSSTKRSAKGEIFPAGDFRDIVVETPPGFIGNPIAVPECPESVEQFACDQDSIVATAEVVVDGFGQGVQRSTVNNLEAPYGYPAKFRFITGNRQVVINAAASLRSDEDYGLEVGSYNTPQIKPVSATFFTFWGSPADDGHDDQRCSSALPPESDCEEGGVNVNKAGENIAFLSNPVDCAEEALRTPKAVINVNTWQDPGQFFTTAVPLEPVIACNQLEFEADFTFEPGDTKADSPASFRTELTVPSEGLTDPDKLMTPTIRETVVDLPKGVVLNASAADGLEACSKEQIGLKGTSFPRPNEIRFTKDPQTCPDASRIGTGELKSELLEDPLQGDLYLAAQGEGNPFGSLFAIYLVIEDPRHGIFIKLPGEVKVNEGDGQQQIVFRDLPPLPFTYLRLSLKGGNRSPLAMPTTCGNYVTMATNTPWSAPESGPPVASANGFEINQGPNGQSCAPTPQDRPFNLGLTAGSKDANAGGHSPFSIRLTRPDGSQELDTLEISQPEGFTAVLKGIPYCSESQIKEIEKRTGKDEQANPACPSASQVGTTLTGAGSGPAPFYTKGKLYLTGPYKDAPLSVIAVTPAVAGPFDLGNVVVRSALHVDPTTARVSATTDAIPQILDGVVLRIRDVRINLDRDNWALNPTSCDPKSVDVTAHGNSGATAKLSSRFQVGGCDKLKFKPKLRGKVSGGSKRGDHPAFTSTLTYPKGPGYANTRYVQVTLPHSEFLENAHIRTICTRAQFALHSCPKGSIYGHAEAQTPLLDQPLKGPVYLRSSSNKLPDLVIALRGPASQPIEVDLAGRVDSIHGGIRTTFEIVPDAAVSKFVLRMQGGDKGLLVNSRNLCKGPAPRMTVRMLAHNNKRADQFPPLENDCGKKKPRKGAKGKAQRGR